jgi:hypothetical protein
MIRLSADSTAAVRAASCRTLGVYILFPSVYSTPLTVASVSKALITAMRDRNMTVRIKACWALGNLCDTFIKQPALVTALDSNTLLPLLDTCITATSDNDKVLCSIMMLINLLCVGASECSASIGQLCTN